MLFRCLCDFSGLFHRCCERIVAQILRDLRVVWNCRIHLIAFPTAERYRANLKPASSFRLEDSQLEATPPEVSADGGRFLWNLYATVAGW
jgi:hypothetical protein